MTGPAKTTDLPQVPHYACIGVSVLWDARRDMCVMIHGQQRRRSACFPLLLAVLVAAAVGIVVIVTMFF